MLLNNKIPLQLNIPIRQTIQQLHKALLKGTSKNLLRAPIVGAWVALEILTYCKYAPVSVPHPPCPQLVSCMRQDRKR